jgi:hypothetical protein
MTFQFFEEHSLDSALINFQYRQQYLHIPVNASTWGKRVCETAGFHRDQWLKKDYKTIIFFRDPIDRWLSGLSTWLTYRLPQHTSLDQIRNNKALLDTLFDTVRQDDHTERQTFFTQNVDWSTAECFYIDSSFHGSVNQYFSNNFNIDISNVAPDHQTTLESGKLIPKKYFQSVLESNSTYMTRVKEFFEIDYNFLKTVNFNNATNIKFWYYDF